ncbi:hypothetical protein PAECIP111890_02906 [Paenibacillus sp. JJ-223]|nr:hypothetical protein PAECIP111890_02906 [Paenibacillus sp. JJ-223]
MDWNSRRNESNGMAVQVTVTFQYMSEVRVHENAFVFFTGLADVKRQIDYPYEVNGVAEHE